MGQTAANTDNNIVRLKFHGRDQTHYLLEYMVSGKSDGGNTFTPLKVLRETFFATETCAKVPTEPKSPKD